MALHATNPANGETLATYEEMTQREVRGSARSTGPSWPGVSQASGHARR